MPAISIQTTDNQTAFALDELVKLKADPANGQDHNWTGPKGPIAGANSNQHEFAMTKDAVGEYRVTAKFGDDPPVTSDPFAITLAEPAAEIPAVFHPTFANTAARALAVIGALVVVALAVLAAVVLKGDVWNELEGRLKIAVVLGLPATVVGAIVAVIGLWMLAVEWRGRMADEPKPTKDGVSKEGFDIAGMSGVIDSIAKLKGGALALVIGAILMLGSAWVAQSAAGAPGPAATPEVTPTPAPG